MLTSAIHNIGIAEIYKMLYKYISLTKKNGYFETKRNNQNSHWFFNTINQQLMDNFYNKKGIKEKIDKEIAKIKSKKSTPFAAAKKLIKNSF